MYQETRNSAILFLLGLFNCNVMARDCFQCSYIEGLSSTQRDCKEPASTSALLKNCPAGQNYCLTVTSNGPAGNTVTRGCSSNAVPYGCLTILGGRSCTSTCKESGCNNKVFELHQQMQTGPGSSLRCYQCNYSSKNGQNDCYGPSISSDYLQNCPNANDRYCLTTIINSQDSVIGNTITRGCSTTTAINGCGTTAGISSCLSTCNTDGCNNQNSVDMVDPDPGDKPLRCYQCSYSRLTSSHTSCKGPNVNEAFLRTCPSNQNYCITTKTSGDDDYINVVRGCASQASPSSCATVSGLQVCYSSCQADGCNGGDLIKSKINFVTIIAVITAAMIISQTI